MSNNGEANGPRAKADQVVFEALCKACEMIVSSRGEQQQQQPTSAPQVSSRFNLTLPEHASVRQILQKWRRALHLPLRLDVYYQHPNSSGSETGSGADAAPQRELLERWCLVYAPPASKEWIQYQHQQQRSGYNKSTAPTAVTLDPIVQLRQVCKKIVVWLRTLYCMARLLPATSFLHSKNPNIGFSLYAISEGTDDDVQLQQQGFLCHPAEGMQPSYVVGTPYGVLTWKVLTAEASVIHRLSGRGQSKQAWNLPTATTSRAIPIRPRDNQNNQQSNAEEVEDDEDYQYFRQQQQYSNDLQTQRSTNNNFHPGGIPQSAPAHLMESPWQAQRQTAQGQRQQHNPSIPPNTYQQPSQFRERVARAPKQHLQRRHTDIGTDGGNREQEGSTPTHSPPVAPKSGEAKRVLSGLSLAMMTLEDKNNHDAPSDAADDTGTPVADSKEKRRAALHQAPPHRRSPQDDSGATASPSRHQYHHSQAQFAHAPQAPVHRDTSQEYGYAYNSHIPWQKIQPSTTNPSLQGNFEDSPGRTTAPSALGSTPPPMLLNPGSHNSNPSSFGKQFLPPRSGSTGAPLTPPFPSRPSGFAATSDPPPASLPTIGTGTAGAASPLQSRPATHLADDAKPHPLTSLDLLHQSPFLWNPNAHGSMLSSLTMPDSSTMLDLKRSLLLTHQQPTDYVASGGDLADEMPFAVEDTAPSAPAAAPALEDLSSLGASTAVASFAQKCATSQRLQLFESRMSEGGGDGGGTAAPDALANQLADYRAFGASLNETPSSSSSVVTNTTATALRT